MEGVTTNQHMNPVVFYVYNYFITAILFVKKITLTNLDHLEVNNYYCKNILYNDCI